MPNLGKELFFTPRKIQKSRAWEKEKVVYTKKEAAAKASKLVERSLKKATKEAELKYKKEATTEKHWIGKEKREKEAQDKADCKAKYIAKAAANKKAYKEAKLAREALKKPQRRTIKEIEEIGQQLISTKQLPNSEEEESDKEVELPLTARNSRAIWKPVYFR